MNDKFGALANTFPEIKQAIEEDAKERDLRRKELWEKEISTEDRIVAWIDILGFSEQLQAVQNADEFREIYRKMLFVHGVFESPSASDKPREQQKVNEDYGRTVLALSDGLVVTASPSAKDSSVMSPYDLSMSFIGDIIEAQAACAAKGIFLRGGISIGPYYYDNNILLSPALVTSYKLETERATYPIIIVDQKHIAELRRLPGIDDYASDAEPSRKYFQPFNAPNSKEGEHYYFLDYLRYLSDPGNHDFYCEADRISYSNRKNTPQKRDRILVSSLSKSAAKAMCLHKRQILSAYHATSSERVAEKYQWLADYQNRTLKGLSKVYNNARINQVDMEQK